MIDIHTHILPGMDDGSSSVQESAQLLQSLKKQGVTRVVFTPHFYAFQEDPQTFSHRRNKAIQKLAPLLNDPELAFHAGAEVHYYSGMSNSDLRPFIITGTNLLLVEMPFGHWDTGVVNEILELTNKYTVVLAHIERYQRWQPFNKPVWQALEKAGVLFQINCSSLLEGWNSRKVIKMLKEGKITFLASDTHNTTTRPPKFDQALEVMSKKLPESEIVSFFERSEQQFG